MKTLTQGRPFRLMLAAASVLALTCAHAQTTSQNAVPASPSGKSTKPSAAASAKTVAPTRYLPNRFGGRAGVYYKVVWGIDDLKVKWAESGEIVRVSWHVLDPQRAQILNDKKAEPSLIDPQAGVSLVIPAVENIGQLRQTQPPEADKSYWMAFSNKGRMVKRGDRVDLMIGTFRAQGLVVD